ncbi:hypothetical protein AXG93_3671s1290 [Marchantia polymorpha subsp. ruderalis]|uniref:CCHC-type domain-containing protein n=1 Tax=Marchantia polymorpha subsp. ruderalis TaxID=1480154 RepID=A0A176WGQ0_MARPO|nr:hypothetical protein AXG93_3671s1290 [Marchantia polymorpha subsp. ruderalis]
MSNNAMEWDIQPLIARYRIAADAWRELARVYQSKSNPHQLHLRQALHSLKMQPGETVSTIITTFQLLLDQLAAIRQTIPEGEALLCLLQSLPNDYETFARSMRVSETLSTQTVITNLLFEEEHLKKQAATNGTRPLYILKKKGWNPSKQQPRRSDDAGTSSSALPESTAKPSFPRQKMKCFSCKKRVHLASECRNKKQESSSSHSTANAEHWLFVTGLSSIGADPTWVIPDVLHVPALRKNLFSVTQQVLQGGGLVIKPDHCII